MKAVLKGIQKFTCRALMVQMQESGCALTEEIKNETISGIMPACN